MKRLLFSLTALLSVAFVNAQTADEIVTKHIDALGGKEKLNQATSVYMESTTEVMGNENPTKTYILTGKGYRSEFEFNGQQIVNVVTSNGGWVINPFGGSAAAIALPAEQYKSSEDQVYIDPLLDYAAKGAKVELVGKEKIKGVENFKLKYTNKDKAETTYFIDPTTYFITQSASKGNAMGQEIVINVTYSDYKKTDAGFYMPYSTNVDMGQFALQVNTKKIEVNKAIDPSVFAMPK